MRYFLDNEFIIRRLHLKSGNLTVYSATVTGAVGHLQNLTPEKSQFYEGEIGKVFKVWIPLQELPSRISEIVPGDQVVDEDGVTYGVSSVKVVPFGSTEYVELIVVQKD